MRQVIYCPNHLHNLCLYSFIFFIMVTKPLPTLNTGIINPIFLSSAEDKLCYTSLIPLLPSDMQMLSVHDHPSAEQDTQTLLSTFAPIARGR